MQLLARRSHGRAELSRKLRQKGFDSAAVDEAIDRALELGLTEADDRVALRYATELADKSGSTPRWAEHKLRSRGFSDSSIRAAIDAAFADWDARGAALSYVGSDENAPRVARRLERRGFPADVVGWMVRHLQSDPEEM